MKNVLIVLFIFQAFTSFSQDKRLALVIGNSNYEKGELKNPVNDAKLISKTLDSLGFDVIEKYNLSTKRELLDAIRDFGVKRESYNVGFVYYAGHGVQIKAENFLLPTKEKFTSEIDIEDYGVSVQSILRYLESKTDQVNILILDACRDNPFEVIWNKTRSLNGGGLAKIAPPTGSLIAFSTDAGKTAADGKNENSIYTESLAKNMLIESISIDQVFRNVRSEVLTKSNGAQRPVESTQLTGNSFYLVRSNYNKQFENAKNQINNKDFLDALSTINFILQNEPNNVQALLWRASIYSSELKIFDKGIIDYNKAIELQPNNALIYSLKADILKDYKQFDEAVKEYSKAIEIDPDNAEYYLDRGRLFDEEMNNNQKALDDYNKAVELEPENKWILFNRAFLFHYKLEEYEKSFSDYSKIIQIDPKYSDAYVNLAILIRDNLKNDKKALDFFNKCVELAPNDFVVYFSRGIFFQDNLHDNEKALKDFNKAIELTPNTAEGHTILGKLYENNLKIYDKALENYSKALELEPENVDKLFDRAYFYQDKLKNYEKSFSDYSKIIQIDPKYSDAYRNLAVISQKNSQLYKKTLDLINKSLRLNEKNSIALINRGVLNYELYYKNALIDFNKAIELDPENADWYSFRGQLYEEKLQLYDNALIDHNKAINLNPRKALYFLIRANFFRIIFKKNDLALQDYNSAINLEPNNATFYSARAIFKLFDLKQPDTAINDFNKAIDLDSSNSISYHNRAKYFLFLEDYESALKDIKKTIFLDKNDPQGYFNLSLIYKKQKKYAQSLVQISKAIELKIGSDYDIWDDKVTSKLEIEDLYILRADLYKLLLDFESTCEDYRNALDTLKEDSKKKKEIELLINENCK